MRKGRKGDFRARSAQSILPKQEILALRAGTTPSRPLLILCVKAFFHLI
jgi:hypothetical protein